MPYFLRGGDLQIFETPEVYKAKNVEGYWGEVTATIDWCERNYVVTPYLAEFYNSCSNLLFVVFGLYGLFMAANQGFEKRILILYLMIIVVGIGSAGFHGTLLNIWQQGDETPMVLALLGWCYNLYFLKPELEQAKPELELKGRYLVITLGAVWTIIHFIFRFVLVFQLSFLAVTIVCGLLLLTEIANCQSREAQIIGYMYVFSMILAFALWLIDCHFCDYLNEHDGAFNPQFHAWWHMICGVACYCGPIFLSYQRAYYLGLKPRITHGIIWFLPIVKTNFRKD